MSCSALRGTIVLRELPSPPYVREAFSVAWVLLLPRRVQPATTAQRGLQRRPSALLDTTVAQERVTTHCALQVTFVPRGARLPPLALVVPTSPLQAVILDVYPVMKVTTARMHPLP